MGTVCYGVVFYSWMLYGSNTSLFLNDTHVLYYPKDTIKSIMPEHRYVISIYYFAVRAWFWATFLFPNLLLTKSFTYRYEKVFLAMMGYSFDWFPCHCIVAIFDLLDLLVSASNLLMFLWFHVL